MSQRVGQFQRVEQTTTLRVDPRLVLGSHLIQLSKAELEQAIETELNENPALERIDFEPEPISQEEVLKTVAPSELRPSSEDREFSRSTGRDEDLPDWVDLAPSVTTLRQHLRAQLAAALPKELQTLGEYVAECVNDKGYLDVAPEEIALANECSLEEVEAVVQVLQGCEPAGVGARDVAECLALQLRGATTFEERLARKIVRESLDDFIARRTLAIARRYRVMPHVVEAAYGEILALNPYPGEGFAPGGPIRPAIEASPASPEIRLSRSEAGWEISVHGPESAALRVSRAYSRRLKELEALRRAPQDEKRHLTTQVQRANDFIGCLEQRRKTMRRIGEYLVENQPGFVSTGDYQFLQPLTRSKMAQDLGLHESTVSRATMDKFVEIATGEIVPFEVFFKPALRVQKMIEDILATENPNNPLSDETIAQMLAKKGVVVARRTVNKYRDRTKLLSSRKRRSA